jgi:D-sedoheptulose 7-phosphate isomerase
MKKFTVSVKDIAHRVKAHIAVQKALLAHDTEIAAVAKVLVDAYAQGKKSLWCGNGGSAADAQHFAAELVGRYYADRRALPALALTVNSSSVTAIANDFDASQMFARQLEAFGAPGDVVVLISTSGTSRNILAAARCARRLGLVTVGLTGKSGGKLKALVDYCVCVPSVDTPRIQEAHGLIGHIWCEMIEKALAA